MATNKNAEVPGSFFSQLKKLAVTVECQISDLQETRSPESCQAHVIKTVTDLKKDVKLMKTNALTCIKKSRDDTDILDKLLSSANSLLSKNQEALTKHEEYLKQYGYIPQDEPKNEDPKKKTEELDEEPSEDKENTIPTSPVKDDGTTSAPTKTTTGTPKFEGFSHLTLDILKAANKKSTAVVESKKPNVAVVQPRKPIPSVPDCFIHSGIMVTPSLLGASSKIDETISGYDLHEALASPQPPILETPGMKQIHKDRDPFPVANLQFEKNTMDSPEAPVFQTPGIKQISTDVSHKRPGEHKSVVSLFKEGGRDGIKKEPAVAKMNSTYLVDSEPQPPDLTYSLEELAEMTGCYNFVQKMPKAPEPLAERLGQNRPNITPPSPELLSQRLSKLEKVKAETSNDMPKKAKYGDMPAPPKLLGNYSFMNQKPPDTVN